MTITFCSTIEILHDALGSGAFRPERALNAAVFDAVTVGVAHRLQKGAIVQLKQVKSAYRHLLADKVFQNAVSQSTADEPVVEKRLRLATEAFAQVK